MKKSCIVALVVAVLSGGCKDRNDAQSEVLDIKGGNGGDSDLLEDAVAWFSGENGVIHACISISSTFGIGFAAARSEIADAYANWMHYIQLSSPDAHDLVQTLALSETPCAAPKSPSAAASAATTTAADASDGIDLRFLLGVPAPGNAAELASYPEVAQELPRYNKPVAFAKRLSHDTHAGRSKGYIWMSPPGAFPFDEDNKVYTLQLGWDLPNVFYAFILHELGHVLGNRHVDKTIMAVNILSLAGETQIPFAMEWYYKSIDPAVKDPRKRRLDWLRSIDQEHELATNFKERRWLGVVGDWVGTTDMSLAADDQLSGRPIQSHSVFELSNWIYASLEAKPSIPEVQVWERPPNFHFEFVSAVDKKLRQCDITDTEIVLDNTESEAPIFLKDRPAAFGGGTEGSPRFTGLLEGTCSLLSGKVRIKYNLDPHSAITMEAKLSTGAYVTVFQSIPAATAPLMRPDIKLPAAP